MMELLLPPPQPALNNELDLKNRFKGVGLIGGFDTHWALGCGWALFGEFALSILYGRFDIDHNESNRSAQENHAKFKVIETQDQFTASRAVFDCVLGIQWSTLFCDNQYGCTLQLGWDQHIFYHQNQYFRVNRVGSIETLTGLPNNGGENIFSQRRGDLSTQGLTLKVEFAF